MIEIAIDEALKEKVTALTLGCISAAVAVTEHDDRLWYEIEARIEELAAELSVEQIGSLPQVEAQRVAYRSLGKDPGRYRGAAEALLRRIAQGKGLYQVNTLVDINNLISLETCHPVGSYDCARLQPPIIFRIGMPGESYKGIGKGLINIENLPVFADWLGPFGSPTSDSERAVITLDSQEILMIIISFGGPTDMEHALTQAVDLLEGYGAAKDIETLIVS